MALIIGPNNNNNRDLFPFIEHTWNRLRDVTEEASFNLKEAMKMLQELDSSDVFGHNQESRRKVCGKKAMSRVDRALRQLASHTTHMEELKLRVHVMREKLEISQGAQTEVLRRMDAVASEMQEAVRRLHEEEEEKKTMVGEFEAAKLSADIANRSASDTSKQLQLNKVEQQKFIEDIAILKQIENSRGRWLAEASAEIEDVVKDTLSKAEVCESELERLQREEGKIVSEWQIKLQNANKRLAHVTAARDWLEEAIVQTRDRIKILEEEKLHLQERLDAEMQQRLHAEGDARALVLTIRETTEQVNVVKEQYSGAVREIEDISNDLRTKEHEVEELLAALETANLQLETQQNVNTAIMRKKEEIEWQLLEAEAQRNKL